jgi:cysteine desulfurase / selenocysteine lyase
MNTQIIRQQFPNIVNNQNNIYLDNASTTLTPSSVLDAMNEYYTKFNSNIHRAQYISAEIATQKFEQARKKVADFINAFPEEIIFTKGTTESINLLSHTLSKNLNENDEIIISESEHHSNLVSWQNLVKQNSEKNVKINFIKLKENKELDLEDLKQKINSKTKILSLCHVSNILGFKNPIKEVIQIAKSINPEIITIIDGAQAISHIKINVKDLNCDFYCFSSHKMYGPKGLGVLYGKKELLQSLEPYQFGGDMISEVTFEKTKYNSLPHKFEAGTQNIPAVIGLGKAIDYINELNICEIQKKEKDLTEYTLEKISIIPEIKIFSHKNSQNIISFTLSIIHPHDIAEHLNNSNISIRAGHLCAMPLVKQVLKQEALCRISIAFYNTKEEIDKLIQALLTLTQESTNPNLINTDDELVKENIVDHYKNPRNLGQLTNAISHIENNPLCGDEIQISLQIENNKLIDIKFQARGCAISIASASMLSELVKGKSIEEIKNLNENDIKKLLQLNLGIVRTKCATLPLVAINKCLSK